MHRFKEIKFNMFSHMENKWWRFVFEWKAALISIAVFVSN